MFILLVKLRIYDWYVILRAKMTHEEVPKAHRDMLGITENLVRVSIGIEDAKDLIADLNQALIKAVRI